VERDGERVEREKNKLLRERKRKGRGGESARVGERYCRLIHPNTETGLPSIPSHPM
jgi:hypothetical protein